MPNWVRTVVWWQVYPLGFVGQEGHLRRLHDWLDYLIELGASGLALGPMFTSTSHGYDTIDYFHVDPRLGDEQDFRALTDAAHSRGIQVLLDGVFNHVGREFPKFGQALAEGPDSEAAQWFHLYWQEGGGEPEYEHFEGHRDLVTLNHESDAVVQFVVDVMCHWLERGADGWRLDATYAIPASFWSRVLPAVRERFPDAYIVGEMIHGDYSQYVQESGLDSVTQYELWKATWSSLNETNWYELEWTLSRHNQFLDAFIPLTFLGNHDVTRIASQFTDERKYPHAVVVLFTVGGTPSVYYGDEQGYRGIKEERAGGDEEVRPPFPDRPSELSELGRHWFRLHQELIGLRRRHPWLEHARTEILHITESELVYRAYAEYSIVVALNLGEGPVSLRAPGGTAVVAGNGTVDGWESVHLPGLGWAVLET